MKKALSILLITILMLSALPFVTVSAAESGKPSGFSTDAGLYVHAVSSSADGEAWQKWQSVHDKSLYQPNPSEKYFFLPSSADKETIDVFNGYGDTVTVNGVDIASQSTAAVPYSTDESYSVRADGATYTLRVMRSGFPISTKSTDPLLRKIMWLYHENNDQHGPEALAEIGRQVNREPKTVLKYILDGTTNEIIFEEDEKDKKQKKDDDKDEDLLLKVRGNPEWEPENSLLQSEQSSMVIPPFAALGNVNRDIVSLHLGFCENCFRPTEKQTFQALALRNKRRSAQAAENIYYRSLNQMRDALVERGFLHTVSLNRLKKTKAAVVYAYQADNDGEWGEIEYDCKTGQFRVVKLAELDLTKSLILPHGKVFAASRFLLFFENLGIKYIEGRFPPLKLSPSFRAVPAEKENRGLKFFPFSW